MPPKKEGKTLSDEQIKSAEIQEQIKDRHNYLKKRFINIPPIKEYTNGDDIEILQKNLDHLDKLKNSHILDIQKHRIMILFS